jgi:hypothetical protein
MLIFQVFISWCHSKNGHWYIIYRLIYLKFNDDFHFHIMKSTWKYIKISYSKIVQNVLKWPRNKDFNFFLKEKEKEKKKRKGKQNGMIAHVSIV